ncbi:hypothetical protein Tco_1309848 [Tanacetum coccineum]
MKDVRHEEEVGIQLQAEEFDLMVVAVDIDEIEEVNANCILMANLQQASTSGTQTDKAPVYDSDGSGEVHHYENCYDNEIFNMFTQEEQYTELLEPITEPHPVQQNNSNVIYVESSVEHNVGIVEQHPATVEETRAYFESLYNNLVTEIEKVNTAKFDELENGYRKSVYQEQCLTKKINALHLSSAKQITTLNEEIANLNNQLSKEKSTVSYLQEERKKLKDDFKTREDELLDKLVQSKKKIKELDIFWLKWGFWKKHERFLRAVVSQDIMSIVQSNSVVETSDFQTELENTKEKMETCIIKKETEYAKLWNDWYKKCVECKYDKISYDKAYNDMQLKIERLQAQLGDLKGQRMNTQCASDTLDSLSQKLKNENTRAQIKIKIDSLQEKLNNAIYENAMLRAQLFDKFSEQNNWSKFPPKVFETIDLSNLVTSHFIPKTQESAFVKPHHVITSSESRNISKNMPRFSSNDMVHNHYLEEAKKKIKERDRNSKTSVMYSARLQNTANNSKPKPRSNNQTSRNWTTSKSSCITITDVPKAEHSRNSCSFSDSKHFLCSTCQKCVYNANHDACVIKFLKKVNSRAKVQSDKTRSRNRPVEQKSHNQKPERWIPTRKSVGTGNNMNDSVIPLRKETCTPNTVICANYSSLIAGTFTAPKPISSKVQHL